MVDHGFAGQEGDVNRACSAFGLDTVNYRAFPDTGPTLAPPVLVEAASSPVHGLDRAPINAPQAIGVGQEEFPQTRGAQPQREQRQQPSGAWSAAQQQTAMPPQMPSAHPLPPPSAAAATAWAPRGAASVAFPLLAQALPAAAQAATAPLAAFSMARNALHLPATAEPPLQENINDAAAFGTAFAAAYRATFGAPGKLPPPASDTTPAFRRS